ncbi:hypothetical protein GYMLUDRAFT_36859 [Collybiopsis luxurians FD-317 M1]|nr:hypothetical protein GYMLUDRAFT_36859 [Collybiopsis luxurians FD-317 M1]
MRPRKPRNPYYLRISKKDVLPVYLYLDDRHLEWMSDIVLQQVLEDLRPKILPKLQAERDTNSGSGGSSLAKKATVETHRGDTYQFCYFFRKTQPHSIVLKTRTYDAAPPTKQAVMPPPPVPAKVLKRKTRMSDKEASRKKQKTKGKSRAVDESESEDALSSSEDRSEDEHSQPSTRPGRSAVDHDGDTPMEEGDISTNESDGDEYVPKSSKKKVTEHSKTIRFSLEMQDDEEEKPKPLLHLQFQGFKILGSCLCIVVEPWPPLRAPSRVPSILRSTPRAPSIAPKDFVTANETGSRARSGTPLFLPDPEDRGRSETPFPDAIHVRPLPVPLYDEDESTPDRGTDDIDYGGMMEFSQVLNAAGDVRAGAVDDDEDMEGAVFFGDADEVREL